MLSFPFGTSEFVGNLELSLFSSEMMNKYWNDKSIDGSIMEYQPTHETLQLIPIIAGGGGGGGGGGAKPSLTIWSDPLTACLLKFCSFVAGFVETIFNINHSWRWHW